MYELHTHGLTDRGIHHPRRVPGRGNRMTRRFGPLLRDAIPKDGSAKAGDISSWVECERLLPARRQRRIRVTSRH